jgi:hypothetical protein
VSYAIAPTFEANKIGVRRVYTLGHFRGLGTPPDPDTLAQLQAAGYDMPTIQSAIALGATDEQLLALPFPASQSEIAAATQQLMSQLSGLQAAPGQPATGAPNFPQSAMPTTISTGFGIFDLATQAGWDAIAVQLSNVQQLVNQVAAQSPKDPDTGANVTQFNSAVVQFANYYSQVIGKSLSPLPLASIPATLSGLGIFGIDDAIIAAVIGIVALAFAAYQWASAKRAASAATVAQAQAQQTAVTGAQSTANTLLTQAAGLVAQANSLPPAQSAQAAQLRAQAAVLQQQAGSLVGQAVSATSAQPGQLTTWFTQNWVAVFAVILGVAVLPNLVKKL